MIRRIFILFFCYLLGLPIIKGTFRQKRLPVFLMRCYLFLGRLVYGLHVEGAENMPTEGPCVIVVHHVSPLGSSFVVGELTLMRGSKLCLFGAVGFPIGIVSRLHPGRLGENVIAGFKGKGLSVVALFKGVEALRAGNAVMLAPAGELAWDGQLQPLAPGAAWLALRAGVPVVPIVSKGAYDIMPRWATWPRLSGKITIQVGRPFYLGDGPCSRVTSEMIQEANQRILKELAALLAQGV